MSAHPNAAPIDPLSAVSVCNELHVWECAGAQTAEGLSGWDSRTRWAI